jgi:adenylate kinase
MSDLNDKPLAIMFFGRPGSGKGTQIELLSERKGYFHVIISQLIQNYFKKHPEDEETKKQKKRYDDGLLVETDWLFGIILQNVRSFLENPNGAGAIILDGSPRTVFETEKLFNLLAELFGRGNIFFVNIDVSADKLLERIEKRLFCANLSNHVFVMSENLKAGDPCPEGDGLLIVRDLDKPETFKIRLETYEKETAPALEFARKNYGVIEVNGDQPVEDVYKEMISKLPV